MNFRLLLVLLAGLLALATKSPRHLKVYFAAQIFNALLVELAYGRVSGMTYTLFYMVGLGCIFAAIVEILLCSRVASWMMASALFMTVLTAGIAVWNTHRFNMGNCIVLSEGGMLTLAGFALGFKVMYLEHKLVHVTLVSLWLALALFDFAYATGAPHVYSLQFWLPATLIGSALLVIAYGMHKDAIEAT